MSIEQRKLAVTDFIWQGDSRCDFSALSELGEAQSLLPSLAGQFAVHLTDGRGHLLARDPLGVNKLFFAVRDRTVASSNYLLELFREGYELGQIFSVPSGNAVYMDAGLPTMQCRGYSRLSFNDRGDGASEDISAAAAQIRAQLDRVFQRIGALVSGRCVYVTMSGGLDSTLIALLAKEHLPGARGVTLSVVRDGGSSPASEDVQFAQRAARDLDIPIDVVQVSAQDVLELLDYVLLWGQDWRDFNVHCGLVNAAIGKALARMIAAPSGGERPLLLTGDTMNELMADYTPVQYKSWELYRLPRLSPGQLRRCLVAGLDSGDREVGILSKMGFDVIQPYAMCAQSYLSLPAGFLERANPKQELARRVAGHRIPEYVLGRPKVRAQAGSSKEIGGTLAVLIDAGRDAEFLKRRWCELFRIAEKDLSELIWAGLYKRPPASESFEGFLGEVGRSRAPRFHAA